MKKSRLIHIFRTLTKKEIRLLRKWLESPAHNQRKDVLVLFEYLLKNDRYLEDKYVVKEKVFGKVYKGETFDDAKMRQVIYFLLKVIEEFLMYQELLSDDVKAKIALASVYRKRRIDNAFEKTITQAEKSQEKSLYRNSYYHQNNYSLEQEKYLYLEKQSKRNVSMNLQDVSNALETTFLTDKLRQTCLMFAHQRAFKAEYDMGFLEEVLGYVEKEELINKIPAIAIYYYGVKLYQGEEKYFDLKNEIYRYTNHFPKPEIRDIYLMSINYCIGKMNTGQEKYIREAFEMYKLGFENKILIESERISRWTFYNVFVIAIKAKEFQWAENFINDYQQYVDEKYRQGFVYHALARLNFERKNYDKTRELLKEAEFNDIIMTLGARTMLLQIYYETDEIDLLDALLESTRTYLQRKEVIGYHKATFKNLLRYTRKLVKVNPFDREEKEKLKAEIQEANPLTEKAWLLDQLDKM
ncbi:MAG: hypothetical protein AB8G22_07565 [Saprospiraceae bacterium]